MIEVLPADELPRGVPRPPVGEAGLGVQGFDPIPSDPPGGESPGQGPIAPQSPLVKAAGFGKGNAYAAMGGKARAERAAILRQIGPVGGGKTPEEFQKYQGLAEGFRKQYVSELARDVGGGECGSGPALMAKFAAMQAAAAQWLTERGQETGNAEDIIKAMQLQNSSRQNLMAAHEMCAKAAIAKRKNANAHEQFEKEFG